MSHSKKTPPLVILALDTGDYDSIQRWSREGRLPHITSLMERGCWGYTTGPELACEYGVGMTLFSGISRAQHGYYYFRQLKPGSHQLHTVTPGDYYAAPFWQHLQGQDQRVLIVDVPDADPVVGLPGYQLSNWATHHGSVETPRAEPQSLLEEARRVFGERMVIHGNPKGILEDDREMYRQLLERVERKGRLCRHLLDQGPFDLISVFFSETDPASTQLWKYRSEANSETSRAHPDLNDAIRNVYVAIDHQFGEILKRVPEDANVFVVSLYGIQDEYPTSTLSESFCQKLGYHQLRQTGQGRDLISPMAIARRLLPERIRRALSQRISQANQELILSDKLCNTTDWSQTTAFAIPSLFTSFIRVNLHGREPMGIVEPGAPYRELLDQLENDLRQLTDAQTGLPTVKSVTRTVDAFSCEPHETLPDLFVEWQPLTHMLERVEHPRATLIQQKPQYCPPSQEKLSGFIAGAGPSVQARGAVGGIELLDLAPTFLSMLGHVPASTMRGSALDLLV